MSSDCRLELLILVVVLPAAGSLAVGFGLILAGMALWFLWPLVLVCWLRNASRSSAPPAAAPAPLQRPQVVDPARALLDALGDDVTGGRR